MGQVFPFARGGVVEYCVKLERYTRIDLAPHLAPLAVFWCNKLLKLLFLLSLACLPCVPNLSLTSVYFVLKGIL